MLGTCESAVCIGIEYESNRALRFEFEWAYILLSMLHDGPV